MRDMASLACRLLQWFCSCVLQQQYLALFVLRGHKLLHNGAPLHDICLAIVRQERKQSMGSYTAARARHRHAALERRPDRLPVQ